MDKNYLIYQWVKGTTRLTIKEYFFVEKTLEEIFDDVNKHLEEKGGMKEKHKKIIMKKHSINEAAFNYAFSVCNSVKEYHL